MNSTKGKVSCGEVGIEAVRSLHKAKHEARKTVLPRCKAAPFLYEPTQERGGGGRGYVGSRPLFSLVSRVQRQQETECSLTCEHNADPRQSTYIESTHYRSNIVVADFKFARDESGSSID